MNDLEVQAEAKDAQIEAMRTTIDKLGEDIYNLEDENDKIKDEAERLRDDDSAERERLAALSAALKEVCLCLTDGLSDAKFLPRNCHKFAQNSRKQPRFTNRVVTNFININSSRKISLAKYPIFLTNLST